MKTLRELMNEPVPSSYTPGSLPSIGPNPGKSNIGLLIQERIAKESASNKIQKALESLRKIAEAQASDESKRQLEEIAAKAYEEGLEKGFIKPNGPEPIRPDSYGKWA